MTAEQIDILFGANAELLKISCMHRGVMQSDGGTQESTKRGDRMSDLIDRQMAIEIIQSMYPGMPRATWRLKDWQKRYEPYIRTENAIRELPSAQPKRKIGTWYCNSDGKIVCSNCQ